MLDGALTIRNAAAVCTTLREAIAQFPAVSIDCTAAAEVDLSFIQLLAASRVSASRSGRTVNLAACPDGPLLNALTRGGFHVTNEDPADARSFWFDGATE